MAAMGFWTALSALSASVVGALLLGEALKRFAGLDRELAGKVFHLLAGSLCLGFSAIHSGLAGGVCAFLIAS